MHRNWLGYLGLLGFLGLLGLFTGNFGFYGFFGFFGWFAFLKIKNDERLVENVNRSCRNAFVASLIISAAAIVAGALTANTGYWIAGFAINFAAIILVFTVSLQLYDKVVKD